MSVFNSNIKLKNTKRQAAKNPSVKASNASIKPFVIATLACVFAISTVFIYDKLNKDIFFPITDVVVSGALEHVTKSELKHAVLNDLKQGFFGIDLNTIAQQIEQKSWVAQVTLRRVWPNKVEILLREHQPIAVWDNTTLLSADGNLFSVTSVAQYESFPSINGQPKQAKELLLAYNELEQLVAHNNLMPLSLKGVKSDEMMVQFNSGLKAVFTLQQKDKQFKRFVALLDNQFMTQKQQQNMIGNKPVKSIDMRYSNGFSVVWQEPSSSQNKTTHFKNKRLNGNQHV